MTRLWIPRPLGYIVAALALATGALAFAALSFTPAHAARPQAPTTYTVNSTKDEPDADPSNGICSSTPSGKCTLRAAIMESDFAAGAHTINLPAGTYKLTRAGYDDTGLVGDLDIKHDITIIGAGSGATIVDGNGSVTQDRVFEILTNAQNVTLSGMTIRSGVSLSSTVGVIGGGGVYMEGSGHLDLTNVIFDSNTGQNGGGIYTNFSSQGGSLTLDHVTLHGNTALAGGVGAGGGAFVYLPSPQSELAIRDSQVDNNTADGTGGGLYVEGASAIQWSIDHSVMYSNTAAAGGAIGNFIPLNLSDSHLYDNHVSMDGGAIEAFSPYAISRTTLEANTAHRFGGGIFDLQTAADPAHPEFAHIEASTFISNYAQYGGGIYHDGFITPGSVLTLLNSTLSGNTVFRPNGGSGSADGGGIYIYGGQAQLFNATIASNRVQLGLPGHGYPGIGGGVYITASTTFTADNSIIAKNTHGNGITTEGTDDCFSSGTVGELAYDLIFDMTNCSVSGPQGGNIVGQDPLLSPLQNNGGSTQTRALAANSPAVDNGAPAGCTGVGGAPLTADQRGWARPYPQGGRCDMGAYEYKPLPPVITVQESDHHVQYNGWRGVSDTNANGGTYRVSNTHNDSVTFKFSGKSVKWISRKGPDEGRAQVKIDGVDMGTVDLYSATVQNQYLKTFKKLAAGNHKLVIKVLGTKNAHATDTNIVVDGFIVGASTTQDDASAVQYGAWSGKTDANASSGSYRTSKKASADIQLTFNGTSVDWITAKGPAYGLAQVWIDGASQGTFDLYDPSQQWQFAISFPGLSEGQHTIEIKPNGTKNANSSDTFVVVDAFRGPFTLIGN